MKPLLIFIALTLPSFAFAQDVEGSPYSECAKVLASPPANALAEMSENGTYGRLSDRTLGPVLFGKTCSVEQITKYMLDAGWEITRGGIRHFDPIRESGRYKSDKALYFCLPERGLWRLLNHCGGGASFFWLDDQITWLVFVPPIRFGG